MCKNDYFVIDTNGNLRVCKEDDIVCSQLGHIIPNPYSSKQNVCELFGYTQGQDYNCWKGMSSADYKGSARKKLKYHYKRVIPGREEEPAYDK